jgi:hypothetical protein
MRRLPLPFLLLPLMTLFGIAACAAPQPGEGQEAGARKDIAAQADTQTTRSAASPTASKPRIGDKVLMPPLGGPLPPQRVEPPVKIDRSCRTDSDCAVKNVGNCCGYYPACVNKDSPTDPEGVQAQCAKDGVAGVCGFPDIQGCRCANHQCIGSTSAIDPSQDPPVPVR